MNARPGRSPAVEDELRDVLGTLAATVKAPSEDPYPRALAQWRRRERRRRLVVAIVAAVVFALADAIGLWALNQAQPDHHIIFNDTGRVEQGPIGRVGHP
jgi:hypothetical protein